MRHPQACERIRSRLPAGLDIPEPFDARDWVEFAEVVRRVPVKMVPLPKRRMEHWEKVFTEQHEKWRQDLRGFRSRNLLIITPLHHPGAMARCLALGELVCKALEKIFEGAGKKADPVNDPMVVLLYPSREEYLKHRPPHAMELGLEWSGGFYSRVQGVSRLYVPEGEGIFQGVTRTLAHELTHHWIDRRFQEFIGPFSEGARGLNLESPGYWVAEGLPSMVEDFAFDLEDDTWEPRNPQARRLDLIASAAKSRQLLPWEMIFLASHNDFLEIPLQANRRMTSPQYLFQYEVGDRSLFYAQSAAACHALLARGESHRKKLLRHLTRFYRGSPDLSPRDLGMSSAEIGREALAYVKSLLAW